MPISLMPCIMPGIMSYIMSGVEKNSGAMGLSMLASTWICTVHGIQIL